MMTRGLTKGEEISLFRYYNAHERYEAIRILCRYETAELLSRLSLIGKRVLEMGCGSLPILATIQRSDFSYVGTDLSESGLRLARRLAPHGRFLVSDAMSPGMLSGRFDVILMKNLLHHLKGPENCLHGVRELLVPGGLVVVLEPNSRCVAANLAKTVLGRLGRSLEESPYGQLEVARLQRAFTATGFEVVETHHSGLLAFPLSGDYARLKLVPMSVSLWRRLIAVDDRLSRLLLRQRRLAPLLGFKVIFHLRSKDGPTTPLMS